MKFENNKFEKDVMTQIRNNCGKVMQKTVAIVMAKTGCPRGRSKNNNGGQSLLQIRRYTGKPIH
jgi:hypothetical protein